MGFNPRTAGTPGFISCTLVTCVKMWFNPCTAGTPELSHVLQLHVSKWGLTLALQVLQDLSRVVL